MIEIRYRLVFHADYHVGTGHGVPGVVDDTLATDGHGLVYLDETTVHGRIRDTAERLARALAPRVPSCDGRLDDGGDLCGVTMKVGQGDLPCAICRVFGSTATPRRWSFSDVRYAPAVAEALGARPRRPLSAEMVERIRRSQMAVQRRNRIDPWLRRPEADHLFAWEMGRPLAPMLGRVSTDLQYGDEALDAALVLAALRITTEIGGKRRRGSGQCRFVITGVEGLEPHGLTDPAPAAVASFVKAALGP